MLAVIPGVEEPLDGSHESSNAAEHAALNRLAMEDGEPGLHLVHTRRAMLLRLGQGEATVMELAEPFKLKLPTVSKHLKVLRRAGLVTQGRKAQWRPCRLEAGPLKDVADFVYRYRHHWEERMDRLDDYLRELRKEEKGI